MDEVVIEKTWQRKEFVHAFRHTARLTLGDVFSCIFFIGLGFVSPICFLFLPLYGVVWLALNMLVLPVQCWNNVLGLQEPRRTVISDSGIEVSSPSMSFKFDWSRFERSTEKAEFYLLVPKKGPRSSIFLKRNFETDGEEARFRSLLKKHTKSQMKANPDLDALLDQFE